MTWLAILLVIISIVLWSSLIITTLVLYDKRENPEETPIQIYESLLGDRTLASVTSSLNKPSIGDIGTFTGYDWPDSKVSGVGGSLHMNNPTILDNINSINYIPQTKESRFT